jgi:hypothetical protein
VAVPGRKYPRAAAEGVHAKPGIVGYNLYAVGYNPYAVGYNLYAAGCDSAGFFRPASFRDGVVQGAGLDQGVFQKITARFIGIKGNSGFRRYLYGYFFGAGRAVGVEDRRQFLFFMGIARGEPDKHGRRIAENRRGRNAVFASI